jgi:putative flippase GtrA
MIINSKKIKFLTIGFLNTIFGYLFSIVIYEIFQDHLTLFIILLISHIITVTFSFFNYRLFVFKSKKSMLNEYAKIHLVYIFSFCINFLIVWILYNYLLWTFWLSRLVSILILICYNYLAHSRFTFK